MSTVVSRRFTCTPQRDAAETWRAIVDMLTKGKTSSSRDALLAVTGIASSVLADHAAQDAAIVVTCDGPRTRIYCLYDDDAIDGSDANEDALGYDALNGNWALSLPCHADDLSWVQNALKQTDNRITARDMADTISIAETVSTEKSAALVLDPKGFLGQ